MTGLMILKQAYSLLGAADKAAKASGDEDGLLALNQIYSEMWQREHMVPFTPLENIRETISLPCRFMPALAYGTAMLLCLNKEESGPYTRLQERYERAATHAGGCMDVRRDVLFSGGKSV